MWNEIDKAYNRIAALLSCKDIRVDRREFEALGVNVYRLQQRIPGPYLHIPWLSRLGFRQVIAIIKADKEMWQRVKEVRRVSDIRFLPFYRFVKTIALFLGRVVYISWSVPITRFPLATSEISEWSTKQKTLFMSAGKKLPVWNCAGEVGLKDEIVERARKEYAVGLKTRIYFSRMPILDYLITSVLDRYPLIGLSKLRKLAYAIQARIEEEEPWLQSEIRGKYLTRYYKRLSSERIVGRVWAYKLIHPVYEKHVVLVEPSRAEDFYAYVSATLSAASVTITEDALIASVLAQPQMLHKLLSETADSIIASYYPVETVVFPTAYELFDPLESRWLDKPVKDIFRILKKMRVIE